MLYGFKALKKQKFPFNKVTIASKSIFLIIVFYAIKNNITIIVKIY